MFSHSAQMIPRVKQEYIPGKKLSDIYIWVRVNNKQYPLHSVLHQESKFS